MPAARELFSRKQTTRACGNVAEQINADHCFPLPAVGTRWVRGPLLGAITFAYPHDDLFYLGAAGEPLSLLAPPPANLSPPLR